MNMLRAQVQIIDGNACVTSRQVAEAFSKRHDHVLRDIRKVMDKCSPSFNGLNFELVDYEDAKGERRPMYLLSKDALMMVTMGYTTPEAMKVKEACIARFNEMEKALAVPNCSNPAEAARAWADEYEARQEAQKTALPNSLRHKQQKLRAAFPEEFTGRK